MLFSAAQISEASELIAKLRRLRSRVKTLDQATIRIETRDGDEWSLQWDWEDLDHDPAVSVRAAIAVELNEAIAATLAHLMDLNVDTSTVVEDVDTDELESA